MALTEDILKANEVLSTLSPEQLTAISTLSANDEAVVIGTKIGEIHGAYETDIKTITGIEKASGEKAYDYNKRILGSYKSQIDSLSAEKATFESQLTGRAVDPALKQKLTDTETRLNSLQALFDAKNTELSAKNTEAAEKIKAVHVEYAFDNAFKELQFKATIPEALKGTLISAAKAEVLAKAKPELMETGSGKVLVFRNSNGELLNNPENKLYPFTAKELVLQTALKDALDLGRKVEGGGTGPVATSAVTEIDLSSAKSQVDADDLISTHLLSKGLTRGSAEFAAEQLKIRNEHNITKLKIR